MKNFLILTLCFLLTFSMTACGKEDTTSNIPDNSELALNTTSSEVTKDVNSSEEIRACLKQLRDTDGGTGFMHESFHSEDAADFTRSWFAWTNTLFGELILNTIKEYPNLLSQIL